MEVLFIFMMSVFVGFELISRVPPTLHTPLMSGTNAIHGIVLVGAILIAGAPHNMAGLVIGFIALIFAGINVVGGYVVTDRMLEMFKAKPGGK
jgi:NAD(P) transhydrogenase subunit alpha